MSIIFRETEINKLISNIQKYYKDEFNEKIVDDVRVFCTDNIREDATLLGAAEGEIGNGTCIMPNNVCDKITVLVTEPNFKIDNCPAIGTIFHELTHACDYTQFFHDYCDNNWDKLWKHELFPIFFWWSEFHATLIQIIYYRKYMAVVDSTYKYSKDTIAKELIYYKYTKYCTELEEAYKEEPKLSYLFSYFGRYCACELYAPEYFKDGCKFSPYVFKYRSDAEEIYHLLFEGQTYERAKENFEKLYDILN